MDSDGDVAADASGEMTKVLPIAPDANESESSATGDATPVTGDVHVTEVNRIAKWPFVVAGLMLLVGVAVAFTWNINVPYFALSPGPVNDASDYITVPEDELLGGEDGDLFFLTVSLKEINAMEYLGALIDEQVDLSPRENIRPAGVTPEQLREQNVQAMASSKINASVVALTHLGYDVTLEGTGAEVTSVIEDSAATGILQEGDLIVAVNGEAVEFSAEASELIGGKPPGETVEIDVLRPLEEGGTEELTVSVTLKPFRFEDEDGNVNEEPDRGMVGVLLLDGPTNIVLPVEVTIDAQNIGGPSAGLMFALEIINQLTEEDITHGRRIAGTGTINAEGEVGPIGGIRQKVYAAIEVGAEVVFVPDGNFDEAVDAAGDDIVVVRVRTIDDALDYLAALGPRS